MEVQRGGGVGNMVRRPQFRQWCYVFRPLFTTGQPPL